jgi:hypothetical protein
VRGVGLAALVALLAALLAPAASAHEVRPGYLELVEAGHGSVAVTWKLPVLDGRVLALEPRLPANCTVVGEPELFVDPTVRIERSRYDCAPGGLAAGTVAVEGLAYTLVDVLVRIERPEASPRTAMLRPESPSLTLGEAPAAGGAGAYLSLGVEHILLGLDHLAFVLALLVLVSGRWMLLKTVTAFTAAHSITLALATFGILVLPPAPVELLIAASILLLAVEIAERERGRPGPVASRPWQVAFGFGLVHGLGFAGALSELGLPEEAVLPALLLFNVGVELGQLAFVAAVLGAVALLRHQARLATIAPRLAAWLVGVPSAYWCIDRLAVMLERV